MKEFDFEELDKAVTTAIGTDEPADNTENTEGEENAELTPVRVVSPAARRSSGRFMDMVHTSSDMRRPVRPGQQPVAESSQDEDDDDLFDYNGPIDAGRGDSEPIPQNEADSDDAPLQSPFIPNAIVEKRPLGRPDSDTLVSDTPLEELFEEPDFKLLEEGPETQLLEATDEPDETITEDAPEELVPTFETESEPVEELAAELAYAPAEAEPSTEVMAVHPPEEAKAQPSALYDTETYHAPLTPAKKKSSAWTVLWVFLLIVLGAGSGAAVYFFVLPLL